MTLAKRKTLALVSLIILFVAVMINPIYGFDMYLQQAATIVIIALLFFDIRRSFLSWSGFLGIVIFTALHAFGARWLYTMVPYNDWGINFLGINVNETFGWTRNHYDRLVHFVFGLSLLPFTRDLTVHWFKGIKSKHALFMAWLLIQCMSLFYELFEWGLTFALSPDQVENYNGQQGDMWDPHKDSALAMLGSTITAARMQIKAGKPF